MGRVRLRGETADEEGTVHGRTDHRGSAEHEAGSATADVCDTVSADGGEGPEPTLVDGFVHDALSDGRRFRILAVVDDYTRENLCPVPDTSLPGARVIRELEAVIARRGLPRQCVSDNGPEFNGWRCSAVLPDHQRDWCACASSRLGVGNDQVS